MNVNMPERRGEGERARFFAETSGALCLLWLKKSRLLLLLLSPPQFDPDALK